MFTGVQDNISILKLFELQEYSKIQRQLSIKDDGRNRQQIQPQQHWSKKKEQYRPDRRN